MKALLSSPFIIIIIFLSFWNGICCDYALFRSLFMSQNHRWPSNLKFVITIEKPSLSMVNLRKNIQRWWSSGSKTIEKPSKAMVPRKKITTIPSSWKKLPVSKPNFVPREKGLIKSQSFTCALIGLHHSWVWQICEVITFCKYLDDTRKSDSFNQVNELKSFGRKFQWNQGEKVWQKRNHRETWDNTCYLKIIAEDLGKHL